MKTIFKKRFCQYFYSGFYFMEIILGIRIIKLLLELTITIKLTFIMQSKATTPDAYIDSLPEDRKTAIAELRRVIKKNIPKGFEEVMGYGMIGYVIPHKLFPGGYHCNPELPVPFINIASQKNFVAIYHMGLYADPKLLAWFNSEYPKHVKTKPDMGKSCLRFKKMDQIPYKLIGELASKMTPKDWLNCYESHFKKQHK